VGSVSAGRKVFRAYGGVAVASQAVYSVSVLLVLPKYVALAALAPFVQKRENATKSDVIFIVILFYGQTNAPDLESSSVVVKVQFSRV
jgi:hypothetical protein